MEQARRVLAEIRTYLGKLSVTQRLLVGSTAVIALMALFLVTQYAGGPRMVPLPGIGPEDQPRVLLALQVAGIKSEIREGGLFVPEGSQRDAIAQLGESGNLPDDTTILFNNLLAKQDWRHSREQHRQQYIFALQNELSRVIGQFRGVRSASVIIDAPEQQGLGRTTREPSASVTVFPEGGRALDQATVDAVASLVAGARSGLLPEHVSVIDGVTRRQHRVTDESLMHANTYLDQRAKVENETRRKLEGLLAYIPGVIVAVTAEVDVTRVSEQTRQYLKENAGTVSLIRSETATSSSQGGAARGAEPGVRSMQGADINQGSSAASKASEQEESQTEFENAIGTTVRDLVDPRGMPTFLAASVNVPESYVAELVRLESTPPDGGKPENPTPQAVRARFDDLRAQIEASVLPHLKARGADAALVGGEVEVAMIPTQVLAAAGGGGGGGVMGLIGGDGALGGSGGLVGTGLLVGLAAVALTMMVMMVRRSAKKVELPTAEELVGLPPNLETDSDLVGEAEEGESALSGIEIGEADIERNKMLDQIGVLIKAEPQKAASLLKRWVVAEE
jgi:flagellar biosynthesis/type III secretory pathway M-ring protein FliF/YscJ